MADRFFATVSKVLVAQFMVIVWVAGVFMLVYGGQQAKAAAVGGMAALVPNIYFAWRISRSAGLEAKKVVRSFYTGESGKLLMTAAIFAIIFQVPNLDILPLLVGYVAVLSVFWFALLMR